MLLPARFPILHPPHPMSSPPPPLPLPPLSKHVQPQHAAACRSTRFLELHIGVLKHAAACRSIHFFEFMCLSALSACSCSVCTGDILPAPCLPSLFLFVLFVHDSPPYMSAAAERFIKDNGYINCVHLPCWPHLFAKVPEAVFDASVLTEQAEFHTGLSNCCLHGHHFGAPNGIVIRRQLLKNGRTFMSNCLMN